MARDSIPVEVYDSRDEFRPGRSGGSVNWARLISGVLLALFGIVCVVCPIEVLAAFAMVAAAFVVVAGVVDIVVYVRRRDTMFAQSGWDLFFAIMLVLFGVFMCLFPVVGVAMMAWLFGFGIIAFGAVQLVSARVFSRVGAGLGAVVGVSAVLEIIFGVLVCIWPANLGVFLGLFAIVRAVDCIVFALPIGRDRTNTLW